MENLLKKKIFVWAVVIAALIVPSSGYVLLGKHTRGLWMLCWMFVFGYITFHLTAIEISFVGRMSGGFAIWAISTLEVYRLARKRWQY